MRGFFGSTAPLPGLLALSSAASAQAQQPNWPTYGPDLWTGGGWIVFGTLTIVVIVVIVVVVVRGRGGADHQVAPDPPPGKTADGSSKARAVRPAIDKMEVDEGPKTLGE